MSRAMRKTAWLLVAALLVTGCADAPEKEIVAQKNVDRLAEMASETAEDRKPIAENREKTPEHYTFSYGSEDKTLAIAVDAQVTLPEAEKLPMYYLQCEGFTQEQVTGLYDYLFQGEETFIYEGSDFTKSACEKRMVELREEIAELENLPDQGESEEEELENLKETLADLEKEYDSLPEESTLHKKPVDSTLVEQKSWQMGKTPEEKVEVTAPGLTCQTEDGRFLSVDNQPISAAGWPCLTYRVDGEVSYMEDEALSVPEAEADARMKPGMTMTQAHARELADGVFAAMGIDVKMMRFFIQTGYTETGRDEDDTLKIHDEDEYSAFQFIYTRVIDDVPVAVTSSTLVSEDDAALIWCYERIMVRVTEDGIQEISWEFPVTLKEAAAENANILSFADAAAVFEEMTPLIYRGRLEEQNTPDSDVVMSYEIAVDQIELNLMRVKDSGSERTGLYVPAWVFYGTETSHFHSRTEQEEWSNTELEPWIILAVNALDGTVIDIVEGY